MPIVRRERAIGVLTVQHVEPRRYEEVEIEALQTVAMVLSELIANADLEEATGRLVAIIRAERPQVVLTSPYLRARQTASLIHAAGGSAAGPDDFVVDESRSKNVVDVTLPTTGNNDRPCLVLPGCIDATKAVAIGTVDAQNTPESANATVQHRVGGEGSQGCEGNSISLYLKRAGGGDTSTISFNVMVP